MRKILIWLIGSLVTTMTLMILSKVKVFSIQAGIPDASTSVSTVIYWFRMLPGFIGMAFALAGGYMMYRVIRYNKTLEASENTVKIYKEQLDAMNSRAQIVADDHKRVVDQLLLAQTEAKELRSRTDITEVLKSQQELLALKKTHDVEISTMLRDAIERGQRQYAEVMDTLNKTLNYLAEQSRIGTKVTEQNHELLLVVNGQVGRITDKLNGVESAVAGLKQIVDTLDTDVIDTPVDDTPPPPRRRRR
jgi:hypothetical protein